MKNIWSLKSLKLVIFLSVHCWRLIRVVIQFFCRSIWETQSLLKAGTRWRIRSGEKIRVVEDAWLLYMGHAFINSQHRALENRVVKCLMKMESKEWDAEVISDMFNERDQVLILGTPLSATQEEDIKNWYKEGSGLYTVKSAFKLVQELNEAWIADDISGFWRRLWNLKIPPKVRNFLWRACNENFPTRVALNSKYAPVSQLCLLCNKCVETTLYCPVSCDFVQWCLQTLRMLL